jgi:hypothetical protein
MRNKSMQFILEVVNECLNKGWMGPEQRRRVERELRHVTHGAAVKNAVEANKAIVALARLLRDVLM